MSLEEHILDIQSRLRNNEYPNEQSISQGIVLRLLTQLQWPVYDTQLIIPEYSVQGKRVDFALCVRKNKPIIFIEVKQPGKTIAADKQLFEYAFHEGIPFAIVTDGNEWHFYLPAEVGNYDERRVYKLDLLERDKEESAYQLERYLAFEHVKNGKALEHAREDYKNISKERQAKENIPIAWEKLLEEKNEILMDIVSEKVESLCGFQPTQKQILSYLTTLNAEIYSPAPSPRTKNDKSIYTPKPSVASPKATSGKAKIKVTFPDGTQICLPRGADTMTEVIRKIGFERVKSLNMQMYGCPIVSNTQHKREKYNWTDAGSGIFVFTHSNTGKKLSQLNEINDALGLGLRIKKV